MGDAEIWWLNFTNILMGVGVLVSLATVAAGAIYEALKRRGESHTA